MRPLLLLGALTTLLGGLPAAPAARPPNLLVIMTDDQGYADVGFNGGRDIPTPHLDAIAAAGVRFTSGYVTYSVCSPSRAGLLTGRYPQRFGHERNPAWQPGNPATGLPLTETLLPAVLGRVGYVSGLVGKWHLGAHPRFHPLARGFDEFFGHVGGGARYFPEELTLTEPAEARDEGESYRLRMRRGHEPVRTTRYLTDEFSDEAVRFVERHHDRPFFLYLAYNAPHTPLQATEEHLARFPHIADPKRRTYAAMVSAVDDGVGRLMAKLRELGIEDDTLVFFLSDNGGPTRDNASDNRPLRGQKGSPWEGGFRVPFAAQWPGRLPAGLVYDHPVSSLDIFATIAALAGAPADPERPLDGVNLLPHLTGERKDAPHEAIYLRMHDRGSFAVRAGDAKLVIPARGEAPQLFDLGPDRAESRNLAAERPDVLARLERLRAAWSAQLVPPAFEGLMTAPRAGEKAKR
jgi:arylsulfatase A-like enzyme